MKLSDSDIFEINSKCPEDQGVWKEPFCVTHIKEHVIYMRWVAGGMRGGNCWNIDDYEIKFIVLSHLEDFLEKIKSA